MSAAAKYRQVRNSRAWPTTSELGQRVRLGAVRKSLRLRDRRRHPARRVRRSSARRANRRVAARSPATSFVCSGVTIEDEVFIGHGVIFINDRYPRATTPTVAANAKSDWKLEHTVVRHGASIGSGAIIMCGVEIGAGAMVGAGALVLRDVPAGSIVAGASRAGLHAARSVELSEVQSMKIKFVDLAAQNREIMSASEREFEEIHERTSYVGGPQVAAFETEFAAFLGVRHVVGVRSGTDALRLALLALGIGPGDEVITAPDDLHRDRRGDRANRRASGIRGYRSRDRQHERPRAAQLLLRSAAASRPQWATRDRSGASLWIARTDRRAATKSPRRSISS